MGVPYRTPSPAREPYISSSNVNSPEGSPLLSTNDSEELFEYIQHTKARSYSVSTMESSRRHKRHMAELSHLQHVFDANIGQHYQQIEKNLTTHGETDPDMTPEMERPKTPTKKRVPMHWHGMLSPSTPGFSMHSSKSHSPCLSDKTSDSGTTETSDNLPFRDRKSEDAFSSAKEYPGEGAEHATPDKMHAAVEEPQPVPPSLSGAMVEYHADVPKEEDAMDVDTAENDIERDAILARQLEETPGPMQTRRSARLRQQPKPEYNLQKPAVTARPARKPCSKDDAPTRSELSIIPCKPDLVPFEGLPTVHSLSWQLQYPPGGSTHPSYPYPPLDPRLIFHQPFVPVIDGLPDITRVPKLVLPMNWKHVSWAGLLPVVFDPYQQAFKLTPVGPMPLTCEELRQGGLHEYVPGGKLHPEYGMLPEMLKLSDGSDAEVFDFEGVDWTLPWEGRLDFHSPSASASRPAPSTSTSTRFDSAISPVASAISSSSDSTVHPWREARDCPNTVIDLADAWRWLATKETNPSAAFIPTPGKKWHGRGANRSYRKIKAPIPELMMFALQAASESLPASCTSPPNPVLQNQDTPNNDKLTNEFCPFKSVATPASVDITLLGDTEFTLMELLCYFPQHYYWGHAAERLSRAGITPSGIRDIICMTRGLDSEAIPRLSTISSAAKIARKRDVKQDVKEDTPNGKEEQDMSSPAATPQASKSVVGDTAPGYTAEDWTYEVWEKIDYPVLALAHGLQRLPTGVDAGPLTALILWCREKGRYQVLLSEVPALLKKEQIEPLIEPGERGCPDKEVLGRYAEALKADRLRVSRSKKRAVEAADGGSGKRRKV